MIAGAGRIWFYLGMYGSFISWVLMLGMVGFLSYDKAPFPRFVFAATEFAINALAYVWSIKTIVVPAFQTMAAKLKLEVAWPEELSELNVGQTWAFAPFIFGATVAALLSSFRFHRVRGTGKFQRLTIRCYGYCFAIAGGCIVVFSVVAFFGSVVPEAAGFIFPNLAPETIAANVRRAGFPSFLWGIGALVLLVGLKFLVALGYVSIGSWFIQVCRRCNFAATPPHLQSPVVLVLRSFDDDRLVNETVSDVPDRDLGFANGLPLVPILFSFIDHAINILQPAADPLPATVTGGLNVPSAIVGNPKEALPRWGTEWYYFDEDA